MPNWLFTLCGEEVKLQPKGLWRTNLAGAGCRRVFEEAMEMQYLPPWRVNSFVRIKCLFNFSGANLLLSSLLVEKTFI